MLLRRRQMFLQRQTESWEKKQEEFEEIRQAHERKVAQKFGIEPGEMVKFQTLKPHKYNIMKYGNRQTPASEFEVDENHVNGRKGEVKLSWDPSTIIKDEKALFSIEFPYVDETLILTTDDEGFFSLEKLEEEEERKSLEAAEEERRKRGEAHTKRLAGQALGGSG